MTSAPSSPKSNCARQSVNDWSKVQYSEFFNWLSSRYLSLKMSSRFGIKNNSYQIHSIFSKRHNFGFFKKLWEPNCANDWIQFIDFCLLLRCNHVVSIMPNPSRILWFLALVALHNHKITLGLISYCFFTCKMQHLYFRPHSDETINDVRSYDLQGTR